MKITYRWMQTFTPIGVPATELAAQLTLAGLEVEAVTPVAPPFSDVVVGEVLECGRHPDAEKLSLCQVTTDGSDRLQVVCGAPNVRAGLRVAVAKVGARLPGGVHIKQAKLRGQASHGMLCSARELGLGTEHDGIMELEPTLPLNQDLRQALELDDVMLEVNATPNRGDCMSVFGIARDYAAARQRRYLAYTAPSVTVVEGAASAGHRTLFPVKLEAPDACPVFGSRIIRGLRAGATSPTWLKERLRRVGLNSISAIVDVTNYVMIELGQPLHAYDLNKLKDGITVRMATAGERIRLLNDQQYTLDADFLVIADGGGPVGLAGIMGGAETAISSATTDVLLEAAHFTPDAVAGRARRLNLFTDAGQRFERGVDPTLPEAALERATELLVACAGGEPAPLQLAAAGLRAAEPPVTLRRDRLTRLLGAPVPDGDVQAVLSAISPQVHATADGWAVQRPPHRFDIRIEADLIEEVARLRGFDQIPERHAVAPQVAGRATESRVPAERLLALFANRGYREALSYTFVDPSLQHQLFPNVAALGLANPIASDLSVMRVSLWPGLLAACRDNLRRQQTRVRLFEVGKKFLPLDSGLDEVETLAGVVTGARYPEQWGSAREAVDFFDVKADVTAALELTGAAESYRFEAAELSCLRPGRTARIYRADEAVGWLGELHPQLARSLGLINAAFLFELEIELAFASNILKFKELSKFPQIRRDLAVVLDEGVPLAVLRENVTVSASGLLRELRVFDVYRGSGIESGRKSVALGLILQDSSRTLTDVDADAVVARVVARLRDVLSATIRDQ